MTLSSLLQPAHSQFALSGVLPVHIVLAQTTIVHNLTLLYFLPLSQQGKFYPLVVKLGTITPHGAP